MSARTSVTLTRFFFSSRRRHTRFDCDWSSDVCSSDLDAGLHQDEIDAETTPLRNPEAYQYTIDPGDVAEVWRRGSVVSSWLMDLTAEIGRASGRGRGEISGGAVSLKKKKRYRDSREPR